MGHGETRQFHLSLQSLFHLDLLLNILFLGNIFYPTALVKEGVTVFSFACVCFVLICHQLKSVVHLQDVMRTTCCHTECLDTIIIVPMKAFSGGHIFWTRCKCNPFKMFFFPHEFPYEEFLWLYLFQRKNVHF